MLINNKCKKIMITNKNGKFISTQIKQGCDVDRFFG